MTEFGLTKPAAVVILCVAAERRAGESFSQRLESVLELHDASPESRRWMDPHRPIGQA